MAVSCPFCGKPSDFLLPVHVASLMNVPEQTVRRWLREGKFPGAEKVNVRGRVAWRVPSTAVLSLLKEE